MSEVRREVFPANGRIVIGSGHFFKLIATPAPIKVRLEREGNNYGGDNLEAGYGIPWAAMPFERIVLDGPVGGTVDFIVGNEQAEYDRVVGVFELKKPAGGSNGTVGITNAVNGIQVRATDLTRRALYVYNQSAVDLFIGYGAAGLTTANGHPLPIGQGFTLHSTKEVRAIAATAGPHDLRYLEEND